MKMPALRLPRGLLMAFGLSLLFMLVGYAQLISDSQSPIFNHAAYQAVFDRPILGTALSGHILWFVIWLSILHLALGGWCWLLARSTQIVLPDKPLEIRQLVGLWFVFTVIWLLVWNSGHYPRSSLGKAYADLMATHLLGLKLHDWITLAYVAGTCWFLLNAASRRGRGLSQRQQTLVAGCVAVPLAVAAVIAWWPVTRIPAAPADKPNIIFLGIDSLRFDEVKRADGRSTTPHVDAFLDGALRFDNAMTPLARTYPSWVSLITGKHPHTTGAFLNLLPQDRVRVGKTLPMMLREQGYHTAYAIDEVRFSNIDASYGFDETVTPPIGSADFIVGTLSDTPLLNLFARSPVGRWCFPYGYANRGTNQVYEPETFVRRLEREIHYSAPMFLAAHMTLPHWPYSWREAVTSRGDPDPARPGYYRAAVARADQQFGEIFADLEARGLLQNAIVVVFSDHGESFTADDSLIDPAHEKLAELRAIPAWGHGTSVLTPHQYRVLLGIRAYGPARKLIDHPTGVTHVAASIEDLTPTILDVLKLKTHDALDGISLLPELRAIGSMESQVAHRVRFTETEFNPLNLIDMTGDITVVNAKSLAEATHYYTVDPETDRIEMKRDFLPSLERNRQFAAVGWSKMLGTFPTPETGAYSFLVVDLKGGSPLVLDGGEDFGQDAEVDEMWKQLCRLLGVIHDAGYKPVKCTATQHVAATTAPR
jgi:arylsulfatase A-like enzyme